MFHPFARLLAPKRASIWLLRSGGVMYAIIRSRAVSQSRHVATKYLCILSSCCHESCAGVVLFFPYFILLSGHAAPSASRAD
jgi:hypothetical protein